MEGNTVRRAILVVAAVTTMFTVSGCAGVLAKKHLSTSEKRAILQRDSQELSTVCRLEDGDRPMNVSVNIERAKTVKDNCGDGAETAACLDAKNWLGIV